MLDQNIKSWDSKLKFALWTDRVTNKKSMSTYPFKLVYGTDAIFPTQLALPIAKLLQEVDSEPNDLTRRIDNLVELQQIESNFWKRLNYTKGKWRKLLTERLKHIFSRLEIWFWNGLRQGRKRENMESLMHSRQVHSSWHRHNKTTLLSYKISQVKNYQVAHLMGGF